MISKTFINLVVKSSTFSPAVLLMVFLLVPSLAISQNFLNGSFENTTSVGCDYNMDNTIFNSKMDNTVAFGLNYAGPGLTGEVDIIEAGCNNPSIPDGIKAICIAGLVVDEVSLELDAPLVAGNNYTFTFWGYGSTQYDPVGNLEVGLSTLSNDFGSQIYTAVMVADTWVQYTVSFVAPNNGQYVTVRNVANATTNYWNHIDHFSFCNPGWTPITVCASDPIIDLNTLITGDTGGTWTGTGVTGNNFDPSSGTQTITYTAPGGCDSIAQITVTNLADASFNLTNYCEGATNAASNIATVGGTFSFNPVPGGGETINPLTGEISNGVGGTTYSIEYLTPAGACQASSTANVAVHANPSIDQLTIIDESCFGENDGSIEINQVSGGSGVYSFSWNINPDPGTFMIDNIQSGNYTVTITDSITSCSSDSIIVLNSDSLCCDISLDTAYTIATECNGTGGEIEVMATGGDGNYSYSINNGAFGTSESFDNLLAGNYEIVVIDGTGTCSDTIQIQLNGVEPVDAFFTMSGSDLKVDETELQVFNESINADTYSWEITGSNGYNETSTLEDFIHNFPNDIGTYHICLIASNNEGCTDEYCNTITIQDDLMIYVPNAFTPNGDGLNENFKPSLSGVDTEGYEFFIFNRWGELLYETNNLTHGWNGTYQGKLVRNGVYIWTISLKDQYTGVRRSFNGHVTVIK